MAIPVLKDHGSAGVTGALKNMSHGTVNNVDRSHAYTFTNVCNQFIPQMASHPIIREQFVLQIMDGIRGGLPGRPVRWEGGKWTWEIQRHPLRDRPRGAGPRRVGHHRRQAGRTDLPPVAASGKAALDPLQTEGFDVRQPQHIALAGALGLGLFDYKSNRGRRHSIDHKVVNI